MQKTDAIFQGIRINPPQKQLVEQIVQQYFQNNAATQSIFVVVR